MGVLSEAGHTTITWSLHFDWLWFSVVLSFAKRIFLDEGESSTYLRYKDKYLMQLGILLV